MISGKYITIADSFLTPDECSELIKKLDTSGSLVHTDRGNAIYERGQFIDSELSRKLLPRVLPHIPQDLRRICVLNETFRFSKYVDGGFFDIHRDTVNQDRYGHRSIMTVNIFLNEGFHGGETDFLDETGTLVIRAIPKPGRAAVFDQQILHRGNKVHGTKYLLRTDVMI